MLKVILFLGLTSAVVNAISLRDAGELNNEELSVLENIGAASEQGRADLAAAIALLQVAPDAALEAPGNVAPEVVQNGFLKNPYRDLLRILNIIRNSRNNKSKKLGERELDTLSIVDAAEQTDLADLTETKRDSVALGQPGGLQGELGALMQADPAQPGDITEADGDVITKLSWCLLCLRCPFRLCQACILCKN